jgi:hypothetical protein
MGGVKVQFLVFLTSALDGGEQSDPHRELNTRLGGPTGRLNPMERRNICALSRESNPASRQPSPSLYRLSYPGSHHGWGSGGTTPHSAFPCK